MRRSKESERLRVKKYKTDKLLSRGEFGAGDRVKTIKEVMREKWKVAAPHKN